MPERPPLTPERRALIARIGGFSKAAQYDGQEATEAARAASPGRDAYWLKQVDPDGTLPEAERHRRARSRQRGPLLAPRAPLGAGPIPPQAPESAGQLWRGGVMTAGNTIVLVGNITRDPELRFTNTGQATVTFGLGVNRKWQNRQTQEWEENVSFFDVVCWREMAENAAECLTKGTRVVVTGRLEQRSWESRDGDKRSKVEVVADEIGPSIRWATAQVTKNARRVSDGRRGAVLVMVRLNEEALGQPPVAWSDLLPAVREELTTRFAVALPDTPPKEAWERLSNDPAQQRELVAGILSRREEALGSELSRVATDVDPETTAALDALEEKFNESDQEDELAGDVLNAHRFLAEHGDNVRYVPVLGRWLIWTGSHWEFDEREQVLLLAQQTVDNLRGWVANGPLDEMKRRAAHLAASSTAPRIRAMVEVARPNVAIKVDDLDRDRDLLACPNGTVNLRTGELHSSRPDDLITRSVDVTYDPDAHSDEWLAFLDRTFRSDTGLVDYVQRLCGYGLTGHTSEHVLGIFYGEGANGKSAMAEAIRSVIGPYSATAAEGLLTQSSERHEERIASLRGVRLLISSELEKQVRLAEALVKLLTGGDRLTGRLLYRDRFQFDPELTIVLLTNYRPRVSGRDEGIWRRVKLVPFTNTVPTEDRILDYGSKLAADNGEAILAWLIEGAGAWYEHGLGTCDAVDDATAHYRQSEDRVARFLEETCTISEDDSVAVTDLYGAWRGWCDSRAEGRPGRQQDFQAALEGVGFDVVEFAKRDRRFVGLDLAGRRGEL